MPETIEDRRRRWDQFAAAALHGFLTIFADPEQECWPEDWRAAQVAAGYADKMMEESDARFSPRLPGPSGQGASPGCGEGRSGEGDAP